MEGIVIKSFDGAPRGVSLLSRDGEWLVGGMFSKDVCKYVRSLNVTSSAFTPLPCHAHTCMWMECILKDNNSPIETRIDRCVQILLTVEESGDLLLYLFGCAQQAEETTKILLAQVGKETIEFQGRLNATPHDLYQSVTCVKLTKECLMSSISSISSLSKEVMHVRLHVGEATNMFTICIPSIDLSFISVSNTNRLK
jgi:hypothetical protein